MCTLCWHGEFVLIMIGGGETVNWMGQFVGLDFLGLAMLSAKLLGQHSN